VLNHATAVVQVHVYSQIILRTCIMQCICLSYLSFHAVMALCDVSYQELHIKSLMLQMTHSLIII